MSLLGRLREWVPGTATDTTIADGGVTVEAGGDPAPAPEPEDDDELNVDDDLLLDGIGSPVFMLDGDGEIVAWNSAIEDLTGATAEEAVGHEHASEMFYPDGRRAQTLADKVLEYPKSVHEEFDVDLKNEWTWLYADTSVMTDQHGVDRSIYFTAMPLYEDGELVAVVETVRDRTEQAKRQQAVEGLVDELGSAMAALMGGRPVPARPVRRRGRLPRRPAAGGRRRPQRDGRGVPGDRRRRRRGDRATGGLRR
nr:PAS domain-containing protein [Halobaculum sp. DT92]